MLFEVNQDNSIKPIEELSWTPSERMLEQYILTPESSDERLLKESIFGEELLLIDNQVNTPNDKRVDILALDRDGRSVIIELKKKQARLGVDMQALQYLAEFSSLKGEAFVGYFAQQMQSLEEDMKGFLRVDVSDINQQSRIILIAQDFDQALYSMGGWLSSNEVAFRCIEYRPLKIESKLLLSFSVVFDRSPTPQYSLVFSPPSKHPGYFWHNIGRDPSDEWWKFLVEKGQIPAKFKNELWDDGYKLLKGYIREDIIIAYANKYGAIGWGKIENTDSYELVKPSSEDYRADHPLCHRLSITWKNIAQNLSQGIPPSDITNEDGLDLFCPISTSVRIKNEEKAEKLIAVLKNKFPKA